MEKINLSFYLWVEGNVMHFKVTEMNERWRDSYSFRSSNGIEIESCCEPELYGSSIFLRGHARSNDNITSCHCFTTKEQAVKAYSEYIYAFNELRQDLQPDGVVADRVQYIPSAIILYEL